MLTELKTGKHVVGVKQSQRAIGGGNAAEAFVAEDCDARIREAFAELCRQQNVPLISVPTMVELGSACGIQVSAAAAALLK